MSIAAGPAVSDHPARTGRGWVIAWLWLIAALVFAMVVVGGATRLTGSGLSITEWNPIMGALPPLSEADWLAVFAKYKAIPQFAIANRDMTLNGFKVIFWWEWTHRFLGRFIGVAFLLPFILFLATGAIRRAEIGRFGLLFVLGAAQGAVGWWMVASGLVDRIDVAPYRLATHLSLASFIFAATVWIALTLDRKPAEINGRSATARRKAGAATLTANLLIAAVFVQIFLGALVAGNDAGLVYNTWPSMNGTFVPDDVLAMEPLWRNFFENAATVQFVHRLGAYAVFALAVAEGLGWIARAQANPRGPRRGRKTAIALLLVVSAQLALGVLTLLYVVPLSLALAHQAGAVILLATALTHRAALR
ncbi:MAG: COX15/CtaA family protein [Ancalomicrobiaceae bacterium]|nr:COX15/CtaA family protein [Ancalomicrobiaceae bacterium]